MAEIKYKYSEADAEYYTHCVKLKPPLTFEEFKNHIGHAFYMGAKEVRMYKDGRYKNNFLTIKKGQFDKSFNEIAYKKLKIEGDIIRKQNLIESDKKTIQFYKNRIAKSQDEKKILTAELTNLI